jgi:myosin protein heavy chain
LDLDDDGASTLVGNETGMFGEKEIDMEVTDSEGEGEIESPAEECGVKRKRTIRVIIRSRAFL